MILLSPHFSSDEMACRCCGRLPASYHTTMAALLYALEQFRAIVGQPVIVNDAYRCVRHNAAVGGVIHSYHELGQAADVHVPGMSYRDMYWAARRVVPLSREKALGGIGCYDTPARLHLDVRQHGHGEWAVVGANEVQLPINSLIPDADNKEPQ